MFSFNFAILELRFSEILLNNVHFISRLLSFNCKNATDFTKKLVFYIESKNVNLICSKSTIGSILYFLSYFFITKVFLDNATQYCYKEGQIQSKVLIVGWYYYFSILCHHQNLQIVVRSLFHYIESLICREKNWIFNTSL